MKSLRNKVILSGIVLVFAFIATIGTTFAWFTVSQEVTVEQMQLNVTAEDSLLIQIASYDEATDAVTGSAPTVSSGYQTTLSNSDIIDAGYTNLLSYRLRPVTAINEYKTGALAGEVDARNLFTINPTSVGNDLVANTAKNDETSGFFIELTFYVFYLGDPGTTATITLTDNSSIATVDANSALQDSVENAVNMSVSFDGGVPYIFGEAVDYGFSYVDGDDGWSDSASGTDDADFNNLLDRANPMVSVTGTLLGTVTNAERVMTFGTATTPGSEVELGTVAVDDSATVTVRIYVEGWSQYTDNEIINAAFDIIFGFKIKSVA